MTQGISEESEAGRRPDDDFIEGPPSALAPAAPEGLPPTAATWPPEPQTGPQRLNTQPAAWAVAAGVVPQPAPAPGGGAAPHMAPASPIGAVPQFAPAGAVPPFAAVGAPPGMRLRRGAITVTDCVSGVVVGLVVAVATFLIAGLGSLLILPFAADLQFGRSFVSWWDATVFLASMTWGAAVSVVGDAASFSGDARAIPGLLFVLVIAAIVAAAGLAARKARPTIGGGLIRAILAATTAAVIVAVVVRLSMPHMVAVGMTLSLGVPIQPSVGMGDLLVHVFLVTVVAAAFGVLVGVGPGGRAGYARSLSLGPGWREWVAAARVGLWHVCMWLPIGAVLAAVALAVATRDLEVPASAVLAAIPFAANGSVAAATIAHLGGLSAGTSVPVGVYGLPVDNVGASDQYSLFSGLPAAAWVAVIPALALAVAAGIRLALLRPRGYRSAGMGVAASLVVIPVIWTCAALLLATVTVTTAVFDIESRLLDFSPTPASLGLALLWAAIIEGVASLLAPRLLACSPGLAWLGGRAIHPTWLGAVPLRPSAARAVGDRLAVWRDVYAVAPPAPWQPVGPPPGGHPVL